MAKKLTTANVVRETTFEELTFGAGIMVDSFDPNTLDVGEILWATNSGLKFKDAPTYEDYGADIDNCPENTLELKKINGRVITATGTALTVTPERIAQLIGSADVSDLKVTPRDELKKEDFKDVWILTDYGDNKVQYIHLMNALNTSGYELNTAKNEKGNFPFELTAHYSLKNQGVVPYDIGIVEIPTE